MKSNVIKFPNGDFKNISFSESLNNFVDNIINSNMNAVKSFDELDILKLTDKPFIRKSILKQINESNSSQYIKDRNKLIVDLSIKGLSSEDIINIEKDNIYSLNIDELLKDNINIFYSKYIQNNSNYIFLRNDKKNRLKSTTVFSIQREIFSNI